VTAGSFLNIADPAFKAAPWPILARFRAEEPVAEVRAGRRRAWLVTRHADATAALKHPLLVKNRAAATGKGTMPAWMPNFARALSRNMLDLDDPDHRRLRALVQPAFNPRLMERLRARVETLSAELLDAMAKRERVDLIADYAAPIPTIVIAELLGIPAGDRLKFRAWTERIVVADTSEWAMLRALPSIRAFVRYLEGLIESKRRSPADDLISALVAAEAEGDRLSADEVMAMAFLLVVAGHETTVNLIGNGALALLENPAEFARLSGDPALAAPCVEEVLRYSGPLMISTERYAREDVELGGARIRKGALVYVSLASANRDETAFPQADRFDIGRQPNRHLAFGDGSHFCLGSALARMEGQVALGALAARFGDLRLAAEPRDLKWKRGATLRGLVTLPVVVA
jgi:cytochrome P450